MHPIIRTEQLAKRVTSAESPSPDSPANGELVLLHDINLTIARGAAVAIVGASGSGKSTLLGLLAGLDTPSQGRVWIDDTDLFALDEDGRARLRGAMIGFVFQSFQLLPNLTALENVMLPLELAGRRDAREVAHAVLVRVGLEPRVHHYPKQLSGGEQQRVAIARAFAPQPKLLFADEPTGNLDRATGTRIADLLFELNREQHTTLILVTHDETLARRCNQRLEIEDGRLSLTEPRAEAAPGIRPPWMAEVSKMQEHFCDLPPTALAPGRMPKCSERGDAQEQPHPSASQTNA